MPSSRLGRYLKNWVDIELPIFELQHVHQGISEIMRWIVIPHIYIYIQILHSWWILMVANSHHTNQGRSPFTSSPSRWSVKFCDLLLFSLANLMHAYFGSATVSFCLCCLVRLYDLKETATIFLDSFILPVQSWSSKISTELCHMQVCTASAKKSAEYLDKDMVVLLNATRVKFRYKDWRSADVFVWCVLMFSLLNLTLWQVYT